MKITNYVGLCVAIGASFISVRASDTPAQAAARAALEQKLNDLGHSQTEPAPAPLRLPSRLLLLLLLLKFPQLLFLLLSHLLPLLWLKLRRLSLP